jgi:subtilisin-like proprotein convertase family protein
VIRQGNRYAVFTLGILVLLSAAAAPAATFSGTNLGAIPEAVTAGGACGTNTTPGERLISFAAAGLIANVTTVGVEVDMTHTWVGDIELVLTAPGGSPSHVIVHKVGAASAAACGDSSNLGAGLLLGFEDGAAGNIWTTAAAGPGDSNIPAGNYRTSAAATGAFTSMNPVFVGLTPAQANGTWTLRVRDSGVGDTGSINAATLFIDQTVPVELQKFVIE